MQLAEVTGEKRVRVIAPTLSVTGKATLEQKQNVGAYARVSTDKEEQESSFERQVEYYTGHIQSRPDWRFVKVYQDDGITGTRAEKRPGFMEMIADCRKGLLDKILVKSVARFARSTVDALKYIHELKDLGISVFFENENIDTLTPGGEVLLTILAGMAEQESRTISSNIRWAYAKKFEAGGIIMHTDKIIGYTRDEKKNIIVEPNEALTIQRIYKEFLGGSSTGAIASGLQADGIATPMAKGDWKPDTVASILKNIQYTGDSIMGRSYKPDVLSEKRVKNKGQRQQYYIENSHPAIISKEVFELAQAEFARRTSMRSHGKTGKGRYSSMYAFSGFLFCGECGAKLRKWHEKTRGGEVRTVWLCSNREHFGKDACSQFTKRDEQIKAAFLRMLDGQVANGGAEFFATLQQNIAAEITSDYLTQIDAIDAEISAIQADALRVNKENRVGNMSNNEYDDIIADFENRLAELREQKSKAIVKNEKLKLAEHRLKEIEKVLSDGLLDKFDDDLFRNLIERVVLVNNTATFCLLSGVEITETLDDEPKEVKIYGA
jgi:DNA invertase Pin-like site-specific DNA recombinase